MTYNIIPGDCRQVVPTLPRCYPFIFADPPFNIGHGYAGYDDSMPWDEYCDFTLAWLKVCWQQLDYNGVMCLHGPDSLVELFLIWARMAQSAVYNPEPIDRPERLAWINWHYRFGQCSRSNWIDARCHCLIYRKGLQHTWNPDAVLVESDRVAYGDKRVDDTENGGKRLPGTVWGIPSDGPYWGRVSGSSSERRSGHPNQLPEAYLARLIKAYTNPGDWVLDPFAGSGTTCAVAVALGRNCTTIDVSAANCMSVSHRMLHCPVRKEILL